MTVRLKKHHMAKSRKKDFTTISVSRANQQRLNSIADEMNSARIDEVITMLIFAWESDELKNPSPETPPSE